MRGLAAQIYEIPGRQARFSAMEGLRAYAAFIVFFVHFTWSFVFETHGIDLDGDPEARTRGLLLAFYHWLMRSHYGVDLFFVLSGFLIFRLVAKPGFSYRRFLRDRWLRIYPVFLVTTVVIGVAFHDPARLASWNFAANLLWLNAVPELGIRAISTPTWSLFFEFGFYLLFPALLLFRGRGPLGARHVLWATALAVVVAATLPPYYVRFLMFFSGALLASVERERVAALAARLPDALVLGLFLASTTFFAARPDARLFTGIFWVTGTALVLQVLYGEGFLHRLFRARPLRYLGNISYSFYLVHPLAIGVVFNFARRWLEAGGLSEGIGLLATGGASLLLSVALATGLFLAFERPYFAWKHGASEPVAGHGREKLGLQQVP